MGRLSFTKDPYSIDLNFLVPKIINAIDQNNLADHITISKTEYVKRLDVAVEVIKKTLDEQFNNPHFCVVPLDHPSYDYWMSLFLSTSEKHIIPLILDYHLKSVSQAHGSIVKYLDQIEHFVLPHFKTVVPIQCQKSEKAISKWIQEKRSNNSIIEITAPDESSEFIKYPYKDLLLEDLSPFIKAESKKDLIMVLNDIPIEGLIVLKPGFKKISLIRAILFLTSKEYILFNKKEAAEWMVKNFVIRKIENGKKELDTFSISSTIKQMSKQLIEPKNAQIKFHDWEVKAVKYHKDSK